MDGLLLNSSGNQLAIWGPRGIRVMELPQRRGKFSEFEGGKDVITCKYEACDKIIIVCTTVHSLTCNFFQHVQSFVIL